MLVYLQTLMKIALWKLGPEDLPDSRFLLGATITAYLLLELPLALLVFGATPVLVQTLLVDVLMLVAYLWLVLRLAGHQRRIRQTLTACFGTGALLGAISAPFTVWRQMSLGTDSGAALPSTIIFAIILWSIAVDGHIISRALSKPVAIGLVVAVTYFFLHTLVLQELLFNGVAG
jgi:hypothetical protein